MSEEHNKLKTQKRSVSYHLFTLLCIFLVVIRETLVLCLQWHSLYYRVVLRSKTKWKHCYMSLNKPVTSTSLGLPFMGGLMVTTSFVCRTTRHVGSVTQYPHRPSWKICKPTTFGMLAHCAFWTPVSDIFQWVWCGYTCLYTSSNPTSIIFTRVW